MPGSGYLHPDYARSLSEFGTPRRLPMSGGWVLDRPIGETGAVDASGCYPLFCCERWASLPADLEHLGPGLVSLSLVADPFGIHDEALLRRAFPDLVLPFKNHYVVDLSEGRARLGSRHHRYYARSAARRLRVENVERPHSFLEEWSTLYDHLARRHAIRGIARFSVSSFERQLQVPGVVMFRALEENRAVGAHLWMTHEDVAYSHLTAMTDRGYRTGAAYALMTAAIDHFSSQNRWLDLGGEAGLSDEGGGLAFFKKGWATGTRMAYLCGRILDPKKYDQLVESTSTPGAGYFPAYRSDESSLARPNGLSR